jgi:hypothetical protein
MPGRCRARRVRSECWWSEAAQPNGYPDEIIWRFIRSDQHKVTAVERTNLSEFCNRKIDVEINHALSQQVTNPERTSGQTEPEVAVIPM